MSVPLASTPLPDVIWYIAVQLPSGTRQEELPRTNWESDVTRAAGPLPSPQNPGNVSAFRSVTSTSSLAEPDGGCWTPETVTVTGPCQAPEKRLDASWSSVSGGRVPSASRSELLQETAPATASAIAHPCTLCMAAPSEQPFYTFRVNSRSVQPGSPFSPRRRWHRSSSN